LEGTPLRKYIISLCLFILLFFIYTPTAFAENTSEPKNERVTIGFTEEIDLSVLENTPYEGHHILHIADAITVTVPSASIGPLKEKAGVAYVEQDERMETDGQVTGWGNKATTGIPEKNLNITGEGVKIGIIDTGISKTHPDLEVTDGVSLVDGVNSYHDDNGHGTHVAGILSAKNNGIGTLGVAPGADIYAIKALNGRGVGNQSDIIAGIEWAINHDLDIINLSVTSSKYSQSLKDALTAAEDAGIVVVAASGNGNKSGGQESGDIMYPARYPQVVSVGSVGRDLEKSPFSYTGPSLAHAAPGEHIYSTYINDSGYAIMSGTSMAAPFASGVFALYMEMYPEAGSEAIRQLVANESIDLGTQGKDPIYGYGFVQSPGSLFWDVNPESWYAESVHVLAQTGYISDSDGSFRPNQPLKQKEAVTAICKKTQSEGKEAPEADSRSGCTAASADSAWMRDFLTQDYQPNAPITRGEISMLIDKAFGMTLPAYENESEISYSDVAESSDYYQSITHLSNLGIISGYEDGRFLPNKEVTRAEFAVIFAKTLQFV